MGNSASSKLPDLVPVASCETARYMGAWFVIAVKPTYFEKTNSNAVEFYTDHRNENDKGYDVYVDFSYNAKEPITSPIKHLDQKGWIKGDNKDNSPNWVVSPFWPVNLKYTIVELGKDYEYTVVGYPTREYCWIMCRKPKMDDKTYEMLTKRLVEKHQYNLDGLRKVPQKWTAAERKKRGFDDWIPDDMLEKDMN